MSWHIFIWLYSWGTEIGLTPIYARNVLPICVVCGLKVTEPNNKKQEDKELLGYKNIFEVITQSKKKQVV
jgi:hypothetical protein